MHDCNWWDVDVEKNMIPTSRCETRKEQNNREYVGVRERVQRNVRMEGAKLLFLQLSGTFNAIQKCSLHLQRQANVTLRKTHL